MMRSVRFVPRANRSGGNSGRQVASPRRSTQVAHNRPSKALKLERSHNQQNQITSTKETNNQKNQTPSYLSPALSKIFDSKSVLQSARAIGITPAFASNASSLIFGIASKASVLSAIEKTQEYRQLSNLAEKENAMEFDRAVDEMKEISDQVLLRSCYRCSHTHVCDHEDHPHINNASAIEIEEVHADPVMSAIDGETLLTQETDLDEVIPPNFTAGNSSTLPPSSSPSSWRGKLAAYTKQWIPTLVVSVVASSLFKNLELSAFIVQRAFSNFFIRAKSLFPFLSFSRE